MSQVVVKIFFFVDPCVFAVGIRASIVHLIPQGIEVDIFACLGQNLRPLRGRLKSDWAEHAYERIIACVLANVPWIGEIVIAQVGHVGLSLFDVGSRVAAAHGGKAVFQHDAEFQSEIIDLFDERVGACKQVPDVAVGALHAIPIDHDAVDARELHQQQVVFDDVFIARSIGADERVVMRGDLALSGHVERYSGFDY